VAGVALVWGTVGVLVRWVDLPAVAVVWSRVAIGALGLAAWSRWRATRATDDAVERLEPPASERLPVWVLPATGLVLTAHWVSLFAAYRLAPIGTVLLITYLAPVIVTAAAPRVLGERSTPTIRWALVVGVIGTALVAGPGARGIRPLGLVLSLVAALTFASLVLVGKRLAREHGGIKVALTQQVVAAIVLAPLAALAGWGPFRWSWAWLIVLGLVHTGAAECLYLWALTRMRVSAHGVLGYLEPVSAVVFGWLLLDEVPRAATIAGGVLIVAAGAIVVRSGSSVGDVTPEVPGGVG
jgi:drug/metabolite transporter (DMT)-like permease